MGVLDLIESSSLIRSVVGEGIMLFYVESLSPWSIALYPG